MTRGAAYVAPGERSSPLFCSAFAQGAEWDLVEDQDLRRGPVAMFGSTKLWPILDQARAEGRTWFYGDHAYFGRVDRLGLDNGFFRVTRNGFQHPGTGDHPKDRFRSFGIDIKPWRGDGVHVLVCPPDAVFADLMGKDAQAWKLDVMLELRKHTDRPIRIRERISGRPRRSLEEDLQNCWALVTFMSNAAVESVLAGIPVIVTGPASAQTMGSSVISDIESPRMPEGREQWAANLAANQWTLDEIRSGLCWREIGGKWRHQS